MQAEDATLQTRIYTYVDQSGRKRDLTGDLARTFLRHHIEDNTEFEAYGLVISQIGLHSIRNMLGDKGQIELFKDHSEVPIRLVVIFSYWIFNLDLVLLYPSWCW